MTTKDNSGKRPARRRIPSADNTDKSSVRKTGVNPQGIRYKAASSTDFPKRKSSDESEKRPFEPRKDNRFSDKDKPYRERGPRFDRDENEQKRPYKSSSSRDFDRKESGDDRSNRPYEPRKDNRFGDKDRPSRERSPRFDRDDKEQKRPYRSTSPRESDRKESGEDSSKRPYEPRKDNRIGDKDKPYRERSPRFDRDENEQKRPYKSSSSRDFDRKESGDDKGKRPYEPRKDNRFGDKEKPGYERTPRFDRAEVSSKPPYKSSEKKYSKTDSSRNRPQTDSAPPKENRKEANTDGLIRLNKYLADAGVCSRREADVLIEAGTVSVNGKIVTELGTKVSIHDKVIYGDQALKRERLRYVLLNKPKGYITTSEDPFERKTVMELVTSACSERIYPVGRLDRNTLGLLLLTNDGELAKKLMHPKHGVKKLYHVELDRPLTKNHLLEIANGLELEDGIAQVDGIAYVTGKDAKNEIGIEIHSGKNRIVRRIFEHFDYKVVKLDRVMYASLTKLNLTRGRWRHLTPTEISVLKSIK